MFCMPAFKPGVALQQLTFEHLQDKDLTAQLLHSCYLLWVHALRTNCAKTAGHAQGLVHRAPLKTYTAKFPTCYSTSAKVPTCYSASKGSDVLDCGKVSQVQTSLHCEARMLGPVTPCRNQV